MRFTLTLLSLAVDVLSKESNGVYVEKDWGVVAGEAPIKTVHEILPTEVRYQIIWGQGCGTIPEHCMKNLLHFEEANDCIHDVAVGCNVVISASPEKSEPLPTVETTIGTNKISVPAVYYNPNDLFFDRVKLSEALLAGAEFEGAEGKMYIDENLGGNPPKGEVEPQKLTTPISTDKGQYIFLDAASATHKFVFRGTFKAVGVTKLVPHEIDHSETLYTISWLKNCDAVSPNCHKSRLDFTAANTCIESANPGCHVKITTDEKTELSLLPVETNINAKVVKVPVVLYNAKKLWFPSFKLTEVTVSDYSFGENALGDLHISKTFGGNPPPGKVDNTVIHLDVKEPKLFIYVDHPFNETNFNFKIRFGTLGEVTQSSLVHKISRANASYRLTHSTGCTGVELGCTRILKFADAEACVKKAPTGCNIGVSVSEPQIQLPSVATNINGKPVSVQAVFYDPKELFFDSLTISKVLLAGAEFADTAGKMYVSDHLGGSPPTGQVNEEDTEVALSVSKGQYIFSDKDIKSAKFTFAGSFKAMGQKKAPKFQESFAQVVSHEE